MIELVHYIIAQIVEDPSNINLTKEETTQEITIFVKLPEEQRALVIGKKGINIKAIRTLASIIARRENKMVYIKIVD